MIVTPPFAANFDRERCRLAGRVRARVIDDDRRIIVAGASGWIGRTVLSLLHEALGPTAFARRVACFGSSEKVVRLINGSQVRQLALSSLPDISAQPSLFFQLAFLTKDKVEGMDAALYVAENCRISQDALAVVNAVGVDRVFIASSGAVRFVEDASAAFDLRLYGGLKREEEEMFAAWAHAPGGSRRVAIGRIFSVSGPFINKLQTYALACFINDALAGRPISVMARQPVFRSYVAVRDIVELALSCLFRRYPHKGLTDGRTFMGIAPSLILPPNGPKRTSSNSTEAICQVWLSTAVLE